jgi:hypothetical protein
MAATKEKGVPCYDKADPDEPLFVIRASDPCAASVIRTWAVQAKIAGHRPAKVEGALQDAIDFEMWQSENLDRVKAPG